MNQLVMKLLIPLAVLITLFTSGSLAIKVAMMPNFGRSHYIVIEKLGEELERRGHEVSIIVGSQATYAVGKPNVKVIKMDEGSKLKINNHAQTMSAISKLPALAMLKASANELSSLQRMYCDLALGDNAIMEELKRADVIVGDSLYPCSALVADKFDLPHVVVVMAALVTPSIQTYGVPQYPAYVPVMTSGLPANMNLMDRISNIFMFFGMKLVLKIYMGGAIYGELKVKYNISPEKTIDESLARVDLLLLTKLFVLDHAQPIPPYIREVGNFMPSPARPLPPDLEAFMQSSGDEGVILVSFGSMLDSMDDHVIQEMITAFSRLPYKIIWRLKPGKMESSLGSNIKAVQWLPQNDILGHNKTRLFITHGGANGLAEAAYHGVPMVCSPWFGDQPDNAQLIKHVGMGEIVDFKSAPADKMVSVINKVLIEESYKDNSARVSKVIRLRPRTAVQEAAELVEYAQAQGHLDHLKPRSLYLPFYQVYLLDVMAVLGIALVIAVALVVGVCRVVIRMCCSGSKKTKTS